MSLRERCKAFLAKAQRDAILRQGSPVDNLVEFVVSEKGREAEPQFDKALPLCLYFQDETDRNTFIELWKESHPNAVMKKVM